MSTFFEIDSTYRNRNLWPSPGQFEISISQTGTKSKEGAVDPVCDSEPILSWSSNSLKTGVASASVIGGTIATPAAGLGYGAITDGLTFSLVTSLAAGNQVPQKADNYMVGLIFRDTTTSQSSRITSYKYLGIDSTGIPGNTYRMLITVDSKITTWAYGDSFTITETTDFGDPVYPLLFVPNGSSQENSYLNYILYNESINDYRTITYYDNINRTISCEPWNIAWSTPVTNNFSIRKTAPAYPLKNSGNVFISGASTSTTIQFINTGPGLASSPNFYKDYFIRIRPYRTGPNGIYSGTVKSESRRITSSSTSSPSCVLTVYPPFNIGNFAGGLLYTFEIEEFSYDNAVPFTYTGTLVQQASACEFELVNLTLPNYPLATGTGGRIAFYPYVYVLLSNVSASSSHLTNIIYSNNPNAVKMIFRVPIYNVQDPFTTPFVRLADINMMQTIKFKPDDNLFFTVLLPNGDVFNTTLIENFSPAAPNAENQVTALFRCKRV